MPEAYRPPSWLKYKPSAARGAVTPPVLFAVRKPGRLNRYDPSWRERLGDAVYDTGRALGLSSTAQQWRENSEFGADFVPGIGEALGADDTARDYAAGNYLGAGINAGATALGVVPVVGDVAGKGIRAFHGSPHDFDRFDLSKIGTGEGAQAYGHGLYFAEEGAVAGQYRLLGSRGGIKYPAEVKSALRELDKLGFDTNAEAISAIESHPDWRTRWDVKDNETAADVIESWLNENPRGHLYEVRINADPDDFLDWDKPLSEQPQKIQDAWNNYTSRNPRWTNFEEVGGQYENPTGRDFIGAYGEDVPHDPNDIFNYRRKFTDDMKNKGIPGIKYLDQGSRNAAEGTRNFVVFDDKLIDIVRKYGIAAAIGAGIISEEMARQMQSQGLLDG
jgi:hypothetical protein